MNHMHAQRGPSNGAYMHYNGGQSQSMYMYNNNTNNNIQHHPQSANYVQAQPQSQAIYPQQQSLQHIISSSMEHQKCVQFLKSRNFLPSTPLAQRQMIIQKIRNALVQRYQHQELERRTQILKQCVTYILQHTNITQNSTKTSNKNMKVNNHTNNATSKSSNNSSNNLLFDDLLSVSQPNTNTMNTTQDDDFSDFASAPPPNASANDSFNAFEAAPNAIDTNHTISNNEVNDDTFEEFSAGPPIDDTFDAFDAPQTDTNTLNVFNAEAIDTKAFDLLGDLQPEQKEAKVEKEDDFMSFIKTIKPKPTIDEYMSAALNNKLHSMNQRGSKPLSAMQLSSPKDNNEPIVFPPIRKHVPSKAIPDVLNQLIVDKLNEEDFGEGFDDFQEAEDIENKRDNEENNDNNDNNANVEEIMNVNNIMDAMNAIESEKEDEINEETFDIPMDEFLNEANVASAEYKTKMKIREAELNKKKQNHILSILEDENTFNPFAEVEEIELEPKKEVSDDPFLALFGTTTVKKSDTAHKKDEVSNEIEIDDDWGDFGEAQDKNDTESFEVKAVAAKSENIKEDDIEMDDFFVAQFETESNTNNDKEESSEKLSKKERKRRKKEKKKKEKLEKKEKEIAKQKEIEQQQEIQKQTEIEAKEKESEEKEKEKEKTAKQLEKERKRKERKRKKKEKQKQKEIERQKAKESEIQKQKEEEIQKQKELKLAQEKDKKEKDKKENDKKKKTKHNKEKKKHKTKDKEAKTEAKKTLNDDNSLQLAMPEDDEWDGFDVESPKSKQTDDFFESQFKSQSQIIITPKDVTQSPQNNIDINNNIDDEDSWGEFDAEPAAASASASISQINIEAPPEEDMKQFRISISAPDEDRDEDNNNNEAEIEDDWGNFGDREEDEMNDDKMDKILSEPEPSISKSIIGGDFDDLREPSSILRAKSDPDIINDKEEEISLSGLQHFIADDRNHDNLELDDDAFAEAHNKNEELSVSRSITTHEADAITGNNNEEDDDNEDDDEVMQAYKNPFAALIDGEDIMEDDANDEDDDNDIYNGEDDDNPFNVDAESETEQAPIIKEEEKKQKKKEAVNDYSDEISESIENEQYEKALLLFELQRKHKEFYANKKETDALELEIRRTKEKRFSDDEEEEEEERIATKQRILKMLIDLDEDKIKLKRDIKEIESDLKQQKLNSMDIQCYDDLCEISKKYAKSNEFEELFGEKKFADYVSSKDDVSKLDAIELKSVILQQKKAHFFIFYISTSEKVSNIDFKLYKQILLLAQSEFEDINDKLSKLMNNLSTLKNDTFLITNYKNEEKLADLFLLRLDYFLILYKICKTIGNGLNLIKNAFVSHEIVDQCMKSWNIIHEIFNDSILETRNQIIQNYLANDNKYEKCIWDITQYNDKNDILPNKEEIAQILLHMNQI